MRKIIYAITILVLLISCSTCKTQYKKHSEPTAVSVQDTNSIKYEMQADTIVLGNALEKNEAYNITKSSMQYAEKSVKSVKFKKLMSKKSKASIGKEPDNNFSYGKIVYSFPDTMFYDKTEVVTLRITRNESESTLIETMIVKDRTVTVDSIRVSSVMTAELIDLSPDKSCFLIKEISTAEQSVEEKGFTEWQWSVKPIKSGSNPVKLIIKIRTNQDGVQSFKDIPVFNKVIFIKAQPISFLKDFWLKYWQWLFSTLIIPLFIYFYKKKKSNKDE